MTANSAKNTGQVLIGLLIAIGLLAILTQTVLTLVVTSYQILTFTNVRTNAKYIATQEMEVIRNLPFNSIGTVGGIPQGILTQTKTTQKNGVTYTIKTNVVYIDDAFDLTAPNDLLPTDYKRVRIDVSWGGIAASDTAPVTLVSDIAPKGIETTNGGGTLVVLVLDGSGNPVPQADVQIRATTLNPQINVSLQTATDGRVILPGAPACNGCYQVTISEPGYSTDRTYATSEVANPTKPHQTVIATKLTQVSFSIDLLSSITVKSTQDRVNNFASLANQGFALRGAKTIGTDAFGNPVYKFSQGFNTGPTAEITVPNIEWDNYTFTSSSSATLDIAGTNPNVPIAVTPNTTVPFSFALSSHTANTLRTIFQTPAKNLIASVSATFSLNNTPIATQSSGLATNPDYGQTFLKTLTPGQYQIVATGSGYLTYSGIATVSGQTVSTITLTPQ
jgi:hypothetical protein